jgi:hypothetical protein
LGVGSSPFRAAAPTEFGGVFKMYFVFRRNAL